MKRIGAIIGALLVMGVALFFLWRETEFFTADVFFHQEQTSPQRIFIPTDFSAAPGESGAIEIRAGASFPEDAREELVGFSTEISWEEENVEFLGASLEGGVFEEENYTLTTEYGETENTILLSAFTTGPGVEIADGENLFQVSFRVKSHVEPGTTIFFPLGTSEVAYKQNPVQIFQWTPVGIGELHVIDAEVNADFYFPEQSTITPGKEKLIPLYANTYYELSGFAFDIDFSADTLEFIEFVTEDTVLEGTNMEIVIDTAHEGRIGILGVTEKEEGIPVGSEDVLLYLRFFAKEATHFGAEDLLQVRRGEVVTADLEYEEVTVREGILSFQEGGDFHLVHALATGPESLRIECNDDVLSVDTMQINMTPSLLTSDTSIEVDGEYILLSGLAPMDEDTIYTLEVSGIEGAKKGSLENGYTKVSFDGYPEAQRASLFQIAEVESLSDTKIRVTFTKDIQLESIEEEDFVIGNLPVETIYASTANVRQLELETAEVIDVGLVRISNKSMLNDLKSTDGELLGKNVAFFALYADDPAELHLVGAQAKKRDMVELNFGMPLLGGSLSDEDFSVSKITFRGLDIIYEELPGLSIGSLSQDHTTLLLTGVDTRSGEIYAAHVSPGSVQANNPEESIITTKGNMFFFFGQGTITTDEEFFGIVGMTAEREDVFRVTMSEDLGEESVDLQDFTLLGADGTRLTVRSFVIEGNEIILTTDKQKDQLYTLKIQRESMESIYGEDVYHARVWNAEAYQEDQIRITEIQPASVLQGETPSLVITGLFFPENPTVYIGSTPVTVQHASDRGITITFPASLEPGTYAVTVEGEYQKAKREHVLNVLDKRIVESISPRVLSDSYASPYKVPNDGTTTTTLWARIEDPRGISDIEKVTADLRELDQGASVALEKHSFVDNTAWYNVEVIVPQTVPTSETPLAIPLTVENKSGEKGHGTVALLVTRDLYESIPPEIVAASLTPSTVTAETDESFQYLVQVTDADGAENVATVVVDASEIGLGMIPLDSSGNTTGNVVWFQSSALTVPEWVEPGEYTTKVTVIDEEGSEAETELSLTLEAPEVGMPYINDEDVFFTPSRYVPNDGTTGFQIFVKASDPDGADDIASVVANLAPLGLTPLGLSEGQIEGKGKWYSSDTITIDPRIERGWKEITITATDSDGSVVTETVEIQVVEPGQYGDAPRIDVDKSYMNPRVLIADEQNTASLYIYVEDGDLPIDRITANLGSVLSYTGAAAEGEATEEGDCVSSEAFVCLKKGLSEGATGHWYSISGLEIREHILPSQNPYFISVVATDEAGVKHEVEYPVFIGDGTMPFQEQETPHILSAVATDTNEVSVLFSSSLDDYRIKENAFRIVFYESQGQTLPIKSFRVRSDRKMVTLKTNVMNEGARYTLIADYEALGLRHRQPTDHQYTFDAYSDNSAKKRFVVEKATAISPNAVEITFNKSIGFSCLDDRGDNFSISKKGSDEELKVQMTQVRSASDGETVVLSTAKQGAGMEYIVRIADLCDFSGNELLLAERIISFEGYYDSEQARSIQNQADFNKDGKVDFYDFSIFATVYGATVSEVPESSLSDMNGDGTIDFADFTLMAQVYGVELEALEADLSSEESSAETDTPSPTEE